MTKNFLILFAFLLCFGSIQVYAQTSPTDTPSETPTASATPTATGCAAVGNVFHILANPVSGALLLEFRARLKTLVYQEHYVPIHIITLLL